jgi:tetratricopeptide (TPR) repeat protein
MISSVQPDDTRRSLGIDGRLALGVVLERLTGRGAPTRLGRYEIRRQLGAGGCGVVYRGWDPELLRDVAIKVLLPASDSSEDATVARARLLREAQALARLRHKNIVEVFDVGVEERGGARDRVYLVMELLRGRTLGDWARAVDPPWDLVLSFWQDVIAGIAAAHEAGIVHRDVKPANAMLGDDGRVKVLDFGLSRAERVATDPMERSDPLLFDDSQLTRSGTVMGTPRYMAPEQHEGKEVTPAADQFALCACIFEALYGRTPFQADDFEGLARQKQAGPPRRPKSSTVPPGVYDVLARGMSPDPAARHPDLGSLAHALRRGARRRHRMMLAVASASLAAVWGTAVLATERRPDACETPAPFAWDDDTRAAVRRGALGSDAPRADRAWARLASRIDGARARLAERRREVCSAQGDTSESGLQALECVSRTEEEIGAALDAIRAAGEDGSDPRAGLRRLQRWTGRNPCAHLGPRGVTPAERELLDEIAADLEEHGMTLSAERVDVTLAFVERWLPTAHALGDNALRVRLLELRGRTHGGAGHYAEAAAALTEAIWLAEAEGDHATAADLVPPALHHLIEAGSPVEEIDRLERLGLDLAQRADEPSAAAAELDVMRGLARIRRGDLDGAEETFLAAERLGLEVAMGEVAVGRARLGLSGVYMIRGAHGSAERYARLVLDDPPPVPSVRAGAIEEAHQRLSLLSFFRGDLDAAAEHVLATIRSAEAELGPGHPTIAFPVAFYGEILFQRGRGDEGIAHMERAREIALGTVGWEHPMLGHILNNLALAESARGNLERALAIAREAREHGGLDHDPSSRESVDSDVLVADILVDLERWDEARPLLRNALAHYGKEVSASLESAAGRLALADGDPGRAVAHLSRALEALDPQSGLPTDRGARGHVVWELAKAEAARGRHEDARDLAAHARALLSSGNPWQQETATELDAWRAQMGWIRT